MPSNYTAANVSQLIADINASNLAGGSNTITLVAGKTFTLTAVNNTTDGANGLPVIAANDNLTILGNGDVIARSTAAPAFRLLDVASGASLNMANLTLQGGLAYFYGSVLSEGGAIYSQGTLNLTNDTLSSNTARGRTYGGSGFGGALYVAGGTVTLTNDVLSSNVAQGGPGNFGKIRPGSGLGGAVYVAGGTVALNNDTLSANVAQGGGTGGGGAVYVAGGTVALTNDTLSTNVAQSAYNGGAGGALYVAGGTVTLTNNTLSSNTARGLTWGLTPFTSGASGFGGALYVAGGTVTLTNDTLSSNVAQGAWGKIGSGSGFGGAVYVAGGTITLRDDTITGNTAKGSGSGLGEGGGLYIAPAATLYLDAFTLANTINNTASTSNNDIFGSYILIP